MSKSIEVPVEIREVSGKGASRRLRREGLVPGILYGGDKESVSLQIPQNFLWRALQDESFYTSVVELTVGDKTQRAILRDLQRHPFKQEIMHIDFQRVTKGQKLTILVPLHFINEEQSPAGKKSGVVISHQINEVEVECRARDLPEYLEVDLGELEVGEIIHLSDIKLPGGVELVDLQHDGEDRIVASAQHVQVQVEPEEGEEVAAGEVPTVADDESADEGDAGEASGDEEKSGDE